MRAIHSTISRPKTYPASLSSDEIVQICHYIDDVLIPRSHEIAVKRVSLIPIEEINGNEFESFLKQDNNYNNNVKVKLILRDELRIRDANNKTPISILRVDFKYPNQNEGLNKRISFKGLKNAPIKKETSVTSVNREFYEYLLAPDQKALADEIKKEFKGTSGKMLCILINQLKSEKLLAIGNRERKKFYHSLKNFMDWECGALTTVMNSPIHEAADKNDISVTLSRIEIIKKKLKIK